MPVGRPREGGGGGGQPPPNKTSKPTSQTTCWRIGFCGRRSDAAHTNKSPAKGDGARWVHLCVLPYRARSVPPKHSKPTTPTPSRAVGFFDHRKSPTGCADHVLSHCDDWNRWAGLSWCPHRACRLSRRDEYRQTHHPNAGRHRWLRTARRTRRKSPATGRGGGAKSAMWAAKKEEETQPTPEHYHRTGATNVCHSNEHRRPTCPGCRQHAPGALAQCHQSGGSSGWLRPLYGGGHA